MGVNFYSINQNTQVKITQCDDETYSKFPDMIFYINGTIFKLPKESYIYRIVSKQKCYLLLIPKNFFSTPMYILSNIFLHNYYTIYDMENKQIGMATAKKINY